MSQRSMFFDAVNGDRSYDSAAFAALFKAIALSDGVIYGHGNNLAVSAPGGMNVQVDLGAAWVSGRFFEVYGSPETLAIQAADPTNPRIDRVVVRLDLTQSGRAVSLAVKTGTPAASPTPPALQRDTSIWELSLAQVYVAAGLATLDSTGKLTQPRRVLGVYQPATWANIDTTADYTTAPVVGQIDIPAASYQRDVILMANLGLYSVDTDKIYVRGVFFYSTDGGTTWQQLGHNPVYNWLALGQYLNYQLSPRVLTLSANTAYKLGIRAGNGVTGGPTVRVYGAPYSSFLALEVDY